jgi:two-component system sensor histidine kinase AlgZ
MQDSQILSTFQDLAPPRPPAPPRVLVFDACQTGVILRAVLFVECVVGVGAMFGAYSFMDWLGRLSMLTGGALPATLAWLVTACSLKKLLARLPNEAQYACGVLLGALAGLYGCGLLALVGFLGSAPWVGSAFAGALLSAALVAALVWRARARAPADTAARLTELQARIRPHFLFNTLNSAIALVRDDPARAEALLEDLSDLFRHALMDQGESVTLAEEVALAQRYLAIEQVRFGDRLQVEWALDPAADSAGCHRCCCNPGGKRRAPRRGAQRRGAQTFAYRPSAGGYGGDQGNQHGARRAGRTRPRAGAGQCAGPPALLHDVQGQFAAACGRACTRCVWRCHCDGTDCSPRHA